MLALLGRSSEASSGQSEDKSSSEGLHIDDWKVGLLERAKELVIEIGVEVSVEVMIWMMMVVRK